MSVADTMRSAEVFTGMFVQTNEHGTNRVVAFRRGVDGALTVAGDWPTGGAGLGAAHLGSQGSVILTADGRFLLVTNAGSDDISVFAIGDGLSLVQTTPSTGIAPMRHCGHRGRGAPRTAGRGPLRRRPVSLCNRRRRPSHLRMARRPQWSADLGRLPQRAPGLGRGTARRHGIRAGAELRPGAARVYGEDALPGLPGMVRFEWDSLDAWYEEDEQVFVHPRNPYTRVDSIRSTRAVRIELDGAVLAESCSPVMVFETGLPTRYYLNRSEVNFDHLVPTSTQTSCPYKGTTSGYWSIRIRDTMHADLAWAYDFPTRQLQPIAGLIAFYNEKVDIHLDGELLERPTTPFFK
jgi:uncharacterized protein (DUF427 family)